MSELKPFEEHNPEPERRCSYCKQYKPLSEFYRNRSTQNGVGYECKECAKTYMPEYKPVAEKRCSVCRRLKPASEFSPQARSSSRLMARCKQCQNATSNRKKLDKRNERKAQLIELMGGCCQRCGYCEFPAALDFHHVNRSEKAITPATLMDPAFTLDSALSELDKCVLLCANCHRAYEGGQLEVEFPKRDGLGYTVARS